MLTLREIIDLAVDCNIPPDSYFEGWFKVSKWQKAIVDHWGGAKGKTILDVGCGAIRLGSEILPEIGEGHYVGIDPISEYIELGNRIAQRLGCSDNVTLIVSSDFDFPTDRKVDIAIAQSVFTHMTPETALLCLERLQCVMKQSAPFVFTFIPDRKERSKGYFYLRKYAFVSKRPPGEQFYRDFAEANGLQYEPFHRIPHPTGQHVAVITF